MIDDTSNKTRTPPTIIQAPTTTVNQWNLTLTSPPLTIREPLYRCPHGHEQHGPGYWRYDDADHHYTSGPVCWGCVCAFFSQFPTAKVEP